MKKIISLLLVLAMALSLVACGAKEEAKPAETQAPAAAPEAAAPEAAPAAPAGNPDGEIAIFWYTFSDTYLSSVRAAMNETLNNAGAKYHDYDANNSQTTQTEQIQTAITKGAAVLVVNQVDTGSDDTTQAIIEMAKNAELPVVFFNREVSQAVIESYDLAAYVGTDTTQAGHMEGKMAGDYVLANYDSIDLNGDGVISYVMFKGQEGNGEADARTKYGVEDCNLVLEGAGKPAIEFYDENNASKYLVDPNGAWSVTEGQNYMQTILSKYSEDTNNMVELVIANNDDMALGAIAALQAAGYNKEGGKYIPVFGVDATDAAKAAIADGSMTGSIKQDNVGMANGVATIAQNMRDAKAIFENIDEATIVDGWRVNIPYSVYTGE